MQLVRGGSIDQRIRHHGPLKAAEATRLIADAARPQLQRGQFVLTGTSLAGERSIAFLKEVAGGKSRTVRQGEQINGMLVAEVKPDRVRLTLGGDSEDLVLKVAGGPRTTAGPAPTAVAPGANPFGGAFPGVPGVPTAAPADDSRLIEQRRRAAPAAPTAEVPPPVPAVAGRGTQLPGASPAAGQGTPASADPAWNEVFERMRSRAQPTK